MLVYGVAVLAGCFIIGQITGEVFGHLLHIDANVGGVGFAMLLLIFVNQWMHRKQLISPDMEKGILFWSNMYIPVVVAMSATQNAKAALSGGTLALAAGVIPVAACFGLVPLIAKLSKKENVHPQNSEA